MMRMTRHNMEKFVFTEEEQREIAQQIAKYPEKQQISAIKEILYIVQERNGWIAQNGIEAVAELLNTSYIKVLEVASFYSMFNLKPVGKYNLQICGTTPCWLRDSDLLFKHVKEKLGVDIGETTEDGMFTLSEVECLGACANAPMMQVNNHEYYEDLTPGNLDRIIEGLRAGKVPTPGSQTGRKSSEPQAS